MKNILYIFVCLIGFSSCNKDLKTNAENNGYTITINAEIADHTKAFLNKFGEKSLDKVDSAIFINQVAIFNGNIKYPERYLITIDQTFGGLTLIVENDSIDKKIKGQELVTAKISGSKLNDELQNYMKNIESIYSKVDALFPEMQRARLENNAEKLKDISAKIQGIETESIEYSFRFASENLASYIAAIILNDLSMKDSIDLKRITTLYKKMSIQVKKSPDAEELDAFIKSYK